MILMKNIKNKQNKIGIRTATIVFTALLVNELYSSVCLCSTIDL